MPHSRKQVRRPLLPSFSEGFSNAVPPIAVPPIAVPPIAVPPIAVPPNLPPPPPPSIFNGFSGLNPQPLAGSPRNTNLLQALQDFFNRRAQSPDRQNTTLSQLFQQRAQENRLRQNNEADLSILRQLQLIDAVQRNGALNRGVRRPGGNARKQRVGNRR